MACALHCGKREGEQKRGWRVEPRRRGQPWGWRGSVTPQAGGSGGRAAGTQGAQSTGELRPVTLARGTRPPHGAGGEGRGNENQDLALPPASSGPPLARAPCIHPEAAVLAARPLNPRSESQLRGAAFRAPGGGWEAEGGGVPRTDVWRRCSLRCGLESRPFSEPQFPLPVKMGWKCPSLSRCQTPQNTLG